MAQPTLPSNWAVISAAGLLVGFGTRLGGRLHLRSRQLRNSPAVAALDRRHHRLHGDGGRSRWRSPIMCWEVEPCGSSPPCLCGLIFGAGLLISGMVQPTKVLGFLDIFGAWDPSLAVVMAAALAVSVPGFRLADRGARPWFAGQYFRPGKSGIDLPLVVGRRAVRNRMGPRRAMPGAGAGEPGDAVARGHRLRRGDGGRDDRSRRLADNRG